MGEFMNNSEKYTTELLNITVSEKDDQILVHWSGKSINRKPNIFITPILKKALKRSSDYNKRMILDFCDIEFMNSSTITPIIKILERAKRSKASVTVKYLESLKWQHLIFSALEIFKTKDQRIVIQGSE